jgi:hypothetical protein
MQRGEGGLVKKIILLGALALAGCASLPGAGDVKKTSRFEDIEGCQFIANYPLFSASVGARNWTVSVGGDTFYKNGAYNCKKDHERTASKSGE